MNVIPVNELVRGLIADTLTFSHVDGPGNRFVVFLQGCNFNCIACHNPQTIPGHAPVPGYHPTRHTVDELLEQIRIAAPFIRGITASGGEATQQPGFLHQLFAAIQSDPKLENLTCFVDSNGACERELWDYLAPVTDGTMIDLKCFDPVIHEEMTGHRNDETLASIAYLSELDLLYEVRLLILPGINDDPELLVRTATWLAALHRIPRLKIIGVRAHGTRPHNPPIEEPDRPALDAIAKIFTDIAPFEITIV